MIETYDQFLKKYHEARDIPYNPIWEDMFGGPSGAVTDDSITELSRAHDNLNRRIVIIPLHGKNAVYVQTFPDEPNIHRVD